ncbi:hypothetical protein Aph02nite_31280 [Actinoplanes philippinensis]|nr:hypothetical protein Aph02nite_31280 [Actinoplanes philippinensis]
MDPVHDELLTRDVDIGDHIVGMRLGRPHPKRVPPLKLQPPGPNRQPGGKLTRSLKISGHHRPG